MRFVNRSTIYTNSESVLVATNYFNGNFYGELEGGVFQALYGETELIGKFIKQAMTDCVFNDGIDVSRNKKSDWPAFQMSKVKSMRDFERDYRRYGMTGLNDHNVTWGLESPSLPNEISMSKNFLPHIGDQELGKSFIEFDRFFCSVFQAKF